MTAAEEYRRRAAECLALAQRINDPHDKARMLEMVEAWRRLADWAAAQDRKRRGEEKDES